jgi:hypothetical protein
VLDVILLMLCAFSAPPPSAEYRLVHDARAVQDTALLRFQEFEVNGVPNWVVATINPNSKSGSATVTGAYIKAETGAVVSPKDAKAVLVKEGSWKKVAAGATAPEHEDYSWTEPLDEDGVVLAEDFYSPFVHGGTIVFLFRPDAAGIERFGTVRLIFPDWHNYVGPAFTFMRSEPIFQRNGHVSRSELSRLTQLLSQDNKLIAALAFRELVASGQVTPTLVRNQLTRAEVNLGAIYTYVVLTNSSSTRQPLVDEVASVAKATHDRTKLRSIALGAFAAGLFHTEDTGTISTSKSVLRVVRQRLKDLNIAVEGDPYLAFIFEKMNL